MKKHIANGVTLLRIAVSAVLLFVEPMSCLFFILYSLGGISDMLDGTIARVLKAESVFGEKLDSVADTVFFSVCGIRLLPCMSPPIWMIFPGIAIILLRFFFFLRRKIMLLPHSVLNRLSGISLFLLPYAYYFVKNFLLWIIPVILCLISGIYDFFSSKTD